MADPNEPRPGDTEAILLRKMLARLANAVGGGGPVSVTLPPGISTEPTLVNVAAATQAAANASAAAAATLVDIAVAVPVSNPFFLEGLEGNLNGQIAKALHIKGKRAGFTAVNVLQDVAEFLTPGLTTLPELNGTENLEVVSSNAQDSAAGTGVRSIRIVYLDTSNSLAQTPPIILNGLTAVALAPKAKAILWMQGTTGGSSGVAAGNIILRVVGGVTHEQITAGDNRSFSARFVVPLGFTAYIARWQNTSIGSATQDARLRAQVNEYDRTLNDLYVVQDHAFVGVNQGATNEIPWLRFPALCKIKVSTISSAVASSNRIDTDFSLLLVAD